MKCYNIFLKKRSVELDRSSKTKKLSSICRLESSFNALSDEDDIEINRQLKRWLGRER